MLLYKKIPIKGWTIMKQLVKERYYIKDVANLTGLSEQLIRKWESRYQIVQPSRLDNGYRIYTHNDLLTLKSVKELRDKSYSIKDAIDIIEEKKQLAQKKYNFIQVDASPYVPKLVEAGTIYDEDHLMILLKQANQQYGLDLFLLNTIQPFLQKVGALWKSKEWDESQETISSLVVRDFLTQISRNFTNNIEAPQVLGLCLPHEHHEIPLQILLLQLKMKGWSTTRASASPKFSSIEQLIKRIKPEKVLLSGSTLTPFKKDPHLLEKLDNLAKRYPNIVFYIGGSGVWKYTEVDKPKHLKVSYTINDIL